MDDAPVLTPSGHITDADVEALQGAIIEIRRGRGCTTIVCDVGSIASPPGIDTVHALARLQLAAMRVGCRIRLRAASLQLQQLLGFMGLADVFPLAEVGEPKRDPE